MNSVNNMRMPGNNGLNVSKLGGTVPLSQKLQSYLNWKSLLIILGVGALLLLAYISYTQYSNNKTAFTANREHATTNTNSNKSANLMLFYVDWCPHCKTAKPEWEALKSDYDGKSINGYNVTFTEYNCTEETAEVSKLMDKYNIEGYPTIKLIKDNQVIEYDAKPTKSTMEQFLNTVL
jgi:thiol-disulfide isomerase/thioredoxin